MGGGYRALQEGIMKVFGFSSELHGNLLKASEEGVGNVLNTL